MDPEITSAEQIAELAQETAELSTAEDAAETPGSAAERAEEAAVVAAAGKLAGGPPAGQAARPGPAMPPLSEEALAAKAEAEITAALAAEAGLPAAPQLTAQQEAELTARERPDGGMAAELAAKVRAEEQGEG
jgi:hypothetical protein